MRIYLRILLFLLGIGFTFLSYVFSPLCSSKFPFGNGIAWTCILAGVITFWAMLRLNKKNEMQIAAYALIFALAGGCGGLITGFLLGVFFDNKNLSPLVGIFVWSPFGFIIGFIIGIMIAITLKLSSPKGAKKARGLYRSTSPATPIQPPSEKNASDKK